jgi:PRC-barrel domain
VDLGPPIAFIAVREGTPVYDADRERVGVVEEVVADEQAGIFEGVVVHTLPLPGRHVVADAEQIEGLYERGVLLSVVRSALRGSDRQARAHGSDGEEQLENPVQAALRRVWDRISGRR